MSRVGEKINIVRNKKGMSAKQLAKKLGVAEKYILEVESGKKIINEALIEKVSKVLDENINDLTMNYEENEQQNAFEMEYGSKTMKPKAKTAVWDDAFSSILKTIPVYNYGLNKIIEKRTLPVIANKIEGHAVDKVLFIRIADDDMMGFRMMKGDTAFGYTTHEIENNCFYLVEYQEERVIRQIKRLDSRKVLLINNSGRVHTETADIKAVVPLVKLEKVEMEL